ncbi:MAG: protein SCO1/2 [Oceanicoccus sp.]|jgi:protein SCO1/2
MLPNFSRCIVHVGIVLLVILTSSVAVAAGSTITLSEPQPLSAFQLTDQNGKEFGVDQLKGRWTMVFVGFTTCPDVCPTTLANLEAVRADLSLRMRPNSIPNIVFLAVDPDRDRSVLKEYLAYFHPNYIGLTGASTEIDKLIDNLDAYYRLDRKSPNDTQYNVIHSATVSVINPQAEVVAKINPPFHPHHTGEYLMKVIRGQKP